MPLKILIAGCSGDERARLEPLVKSVIGKSRAQEGSWHVSLVKVGRKLSATLAGPGLQKVSFAAAEEELRASILDALGKAGVGGQPPAPAPARVPNQPPAPGNAGPVSQPPAPARAGLPEQPPAPAPAEAAREAEPQKAGDRHTCGACQKPYLVIYEAQDGEAQTAVPVACPHCWQVNQVSVGEWAAVGQDYRSEKV